METMTEMGTGKQIDELSKRVDFGFEQMDRRVTGFEVAVDRRFVQVDKRFSEFQAGVDRRFDEVDRRFEEVDRRFDGVDHRFDRVEGDLRELRSDVKAGFESLQRTIIWFFGSILISVIAAVVVLLLSHS